MTGSNDSGELLERSGQLAALDAARAAVVESSAGRLVFVSGEAGAGKTALLRRFCDQHGDPVRVLWGSCDALLTPGPLGPLFEVAEATGAEFEEMVAGGAKPHEVTSALIRELRGRTPPILVLEDVHWADEATLDVLRLLGRRIERVPALVLVSYRDDELERTHPLRIVLGEMATSGGVERLDVPLLTASAVSALADPHGVDGADLFHKTNGNPFFVSAVLAAATVEIPDTVRDAVLARVARLSEDARTLVDAVSVVPPKAELWLLETLVGEGVEGLDECIAAGVLAPEPGAVAFRHELSRLAVEASVPPDRRRALHRTALAALRTPPAGGPDLARLAHHAEAAADAAAVMEFAPAAGERAAAMGAHRQAAEQYARALRFAGEIVTPEVGELLGKLAYERYCTGEFDAALDAQVQSLDCWRALGEPSREGDALRSLSRLLRFVGRTGEAAERGRDAVAMLEGLPPGRELAMAYGNLAHICMTAEDAPGTMDWGTRAIELGQRLDDDEAVVYGLTNVGAVQFLAEASEGIEVLDCALELALEASMEEHAGRAYLNFVWWSLRRRDAAVADRHLDAGLEYCGERGLDLWRLFLVACRARRELDAGRWDSAAASAGTALRDPRTWPVPRVLALTVLGLVRARRGEPDAAEQLDEALALAEPTGELQRIGPVATARAEAAWLEGDRVGVEQAAAMGLDLALRRRAPWVVGELAAWRRRAGGVAEPPPDAAEPFRLELAGNAAQAARIWTELGCPYESALALAGADDEETLRAALTALQGLGADPAAAIVSRRLRERGARGVPRGPRPATRSNPAGLTARELEVLSLVAEGLRNADIAERLFLSERTVGHHVSAILRKLDVSTRAEASAEAVRLGIAAQDR